MIENELKIKIFKNFIDSINKDEFYNAHEILEEIWFPIRFNNDDNTKILKAFINGAVALELKKRKKIEQSKKVWENYLKYNHLIKNDSIYYKYYYEMDILLKIKFN